MRNDVMQTVLGGRVRWRSGSDPEKARRQLRGEAELDAAPRRVRTGEPRHSTRRRSNYLERMLRSRCGQPWSRVFKALTTRLDPRVEAAGAVRSMLRAMVHERVVRTERGFVAQTRLGPTLLRDAFYVHPRSGCLEYAPGDPPRAKPHPWRIEHAGQLYVRHGRHWYAVELAALAYCPRRRWVHYQGNLRDVLLDVPVGAASQKARTTLYGAPQFYAVKSRRVGRPTLRRLGAPLS